MIKLPVKVVAPETVATKLLTANYLRIGKETTAADGGQELVKRQIAIKAKGYHIYFLSGSSRSRPSIVFSYLYRSVPTMEIQGEATYMVNTMPPLSTNRASRGTAPDQKVRTPSSLNIRAAQTKLFLYSLLASIDCILILNQPLIRFCP